MAAHPGLRVHQDLGGGDPLARPEGGRGAIALGARHGGLPALFYAEARAASRGFSVQTASITDSTLHDAAVEQCIVTRVRTWTFPAPDGGGVVAVEYPFVFTSSP